MTLTETADTSGITGSGTYVLPGTVTVTVPGIGTGTFTDLMEVFSNQSVADGGFFDLTQGNVLFSNNAAFATYDLSTAIGPLSGPSVREYLGHLRDDPRKLLVQFRGLDRDVHGSQ